MCYYILCGSESCIVHSEFRTVIQCLVISYVFTHSLVFSDDFKCFYRFSLIFIRFTRFHMISLHFGGLLATRSGQGVRKLEIKNPLSLWFIDVSEQLGPTSEHYMISPVFTIPDICHRQHQKNLLCTELSPHDKLL